MFKLAGVSKDYAGRRVIEGLDLAIAPATTTALIGPSGCGKSTILRMLIGLLRPERGTVTFDGREVTPDSAPELRRRMGYVIQDGGLLPHLTARGNVTLMARYLRLPAERVAARVRELTDLARLPGDALDRYPSQLSGGQRQRVGLMRALMLDPDALLLDEPMGALDPLVRAELQEDLRAAFARLGKTVVLVTHDLGEAAYLAEHIVLLRDGRIVQQGAIADLVARPADAFVSRFLRAHRPPDLSGMPPS